MSHELCKRYRPKTFADMIGQERAVSVVESWLTAGQVPHAILCTGPSGTGKTTLFRALRRNLGCHRSEYREINCATEESPLDMVRRLDQSALLRPVLGKCRVFYLDEFQALSRAGFAQQGLLKLLEDTPESAYFFLATTDASKIIPTIQTRCAKLELQALSDKDMESLLRKVIAAEKANVNGDVTERIITCSSGSPRMALQHLEKVYRLKSAADQLAAITAPETETAAIQIARALLDKKKWDEVRKLLLETEEDPESIRRLVLAYARKVLLSGSNGRAYLLITAFEPQFAYDGQAASLARAAYEVFSHRD